MRTSIVFLLNVLLVYAANNEFLPIYRPSSSSGLNLLICRAAGQGDANLMAFLHKHYPEGFLRFHLCGGSGILERAAEGGNGLVARLLIIFGIDPNFISYQSALHVSAMSDTRLPVTFELLDAGVNIDVKSLSGFTPLLQAIVSKSYNNIKELLIAGANRSIYSKEEETPVSKALLIPSLDNLAPVLLGAKKLPSSEYRDYHCRRERQYRYPLVYIRDMDNFDAENKGNSTKESQNTSNLYIMDYLLRTILHGHQHSRADIEKFASAINSTDLFSRTPLHEAVIRNEYGYSEDLLQLGANVHAADWLGRTPLHLASLCRHRGIKNLLLKWGADPRIPDKRNQLPIDLEHRL